MNKNKITLKDLLQRKEAIRSKRTNETKSLYIRSLDGVITIQKPDRTLCLDAIGMDQEGDAYMVYNCVTEPNLKDPDLQQEYGCVTPMEIVEKLFEPGEIANIAKESVELAGYGDSVTAVDEIKNL